MQKKCAIEKAFNRKYPEQVVLVTTCGPQAKANVMAVGWIAQASSEPVMLVLGIDDQAYTYELIRKTKQFVVAFPNETMAKATLIAGTRHGHKRDKIAECGLKTQKASKVRAPLIADAVANLECTLVTVYKPGDCPLIVGKVVAAHEHTNKSVKRLVTAGPGYKLTGVRPK